MYSQFAGRIGKTGKGGYAPACSLPRFLLAARPSDQGVTLQAERACLDVYGPRPIATGLAGSGSRSQLLTYIRLPDRRERSSSSPRATMDFRALPPQRRQGIGRSHAGPDTRFGKRRSDRFAIFYQSLQLLGETDRSFHLGLLSGCANRKTGVIGAVAGEQAPSDARILVGECDGDDVGVSPLPHLA